MLPAIANGIERALPGGIRNRAETLLSADSPYHHPIASFYPNATDAHNPTTRCVVT
jgi:hypothetical protein